jgi:nucleotide sugar dehydrogenase
MKSIGVIGVGRLGICTALVLEKAGYTVVCYDVNQTIRDGINKRMLESPEKGVSEMLASAKNISAVDSLKELLHLDTFFCVVATPSLPDGSYNHSYVDAVAEEMIPLLVKQQSSRKLFNICCTTMPGYCDSLQKKFESHGLAVDVCYNPEFIAQGDILHGFYNPDILLIGEANTACGDTLEAMYKSFVKTNPALCRMTRKEAEITKISINCFITTKISFANTIGDLCIRNGLNADRVLKAIGSDLRIGRKYLNWGHGYGGPCFPRDNRALCLFSKGEGVQNRIGEATDAVNDSHLDFLVRELSAMAKAEGKQFLFRDLAYKPGTVILEESQTLKLANQLDLEGFVVHIQESSEMETEMKSQGFSQFFYVDSTVNPSNYIVVDKDLSCFRMRM